MKTKQQQPATLLPSYETLMAQAQVFASAWAIVGSRFDLGEGTEVANQEKANLADMFRRLLTANDTLHAENEQLRAGYDAARQEIASLKAQLYDQRAMGLCHVCGWKGVIDYPDGPVCVACEHDKTLSPQPTAQPLHVAATSCPHEIDKDKIVLHFDSKQSGKNALAQLAARLQAAQAQEDAGGWMRDGALLYRLTGEHRPTNFDEIRVTMANGSRDIGQMSAQAERLLVMLTAPQPAPVKRTVWVNLYGRQLESVCHPTEEDADKHASPNRIGGKAYPLEIEEGARAVTAVPAIGQTDFDAVAPTQAGEYQPSSADMVMAALDTEEWGLERIQRCDYISDEGNREGAWLVKRQKAPYCACYTDKPGAPYGPRSWSGPTALDALQKAADDLGIRLPQPAARGVAFAALKHPAVKPDMLVNGGALKLALNVLRRAGKNEVADELECTAQAAPVEAKHSTACLYHYALSRLGLMDNTGLRVLFWDAHNRLSWDSKTDWYVTPDADKADCGQCNAARAAQGGNHD